MKPTSPTNGPQRAWGLQITRPGFIRPCGSSACLIARIMPSATGVLRCASSSRFSAPMPCSAEIEPPQRADRVVDDRVDRVLVRVAGSRAPSSPAGGLHVVVQVAVAEVAEVDQPRRRGSARCSAASVRCDEVGDRRDRQRDVVLDVRPFLGLRQRDRFAQVPQRVRLRRGSRRPRRRRSGRARAPPPAAPRSAAARVRLALGVGLLEQHRPRRRRQRLAQLREVLGARASSDERVHHLEAGQRRRRAARCASCSSATQRRATRRRASAVIVRRRPRIQLQRRRGDDAERAFAADEQVAQVVAGVVLAQAAQAVPDLALRR